MFSKLKKKFAIVLALAMVLTLVMPVAPSAKAAGKVTITVTNLPSNTLTLKKGQSKVLKVKATGGVTYKTSKKTVATVSAAGKVTAKKNGTANITITSKKNTKTKVTIKVTVGTPVTKVKLNKTKLNLVVKQSQTLKATVTPKKPSNKKIVWTSSNEKIATVKNGKVTAKKAGTVKITAQAADGSGKKATCTVKVSKPVNLKAVAVVNGQTINFSLDSAKALTMADIVIKKKSYAHGNYMKVCNLVSLATADNINYTAVIDNDTRLYVGEYVQVNIPAGIGTVTALDACFTEPACGFTYDATYTFNMSKETKLNDTIDYDDFNYGPTGYYNVTLTGGTLPAGTNVRYKEGAAYVYGIPTTPGVYTAVFSATDELGNAYSLTKTYLIGSDNHIAAAYTPVYALTDSSYYKYPAVVGGSGSYKYQIVGTDFNTKIDSDGELRGSFAMPGSYPISVQITDSNNAALTTSTTCVYNVAQACSVSGIIKGADGNAIVRNYCNIRFINKNRGDRYSSYVYTSSNYSDGAFSQKLVAGVYDIEATYSRGETNVTQYLYNVAISSSQSGFDIALPLYKVQVFGNNLLKSFGTWRDAYGDSYADGDIIYLKAGSYTLTYEEYSWLKAVINVTVPSAQAFVTAQIVPEVAGTVGPGTIPALTTNKKGVIYQFVPDANTAGYYSVEVGQGAEVELYYQDDSGSWNSYSTSRYYEANKTYYFKVSSNDPVTTFTLTKE